MSDRPLVLTLITAIALASAAPLPAAALTPLFPWKKTEEPAKPAPKKTVGPASHLPPDLQAVRKNLLDGKRVSYAQLQALADARDGVGAVKLAERIRDQGNPALATHALHYFAIAAYQDRGYAVRPMLEILNDPAQDLTASHLESAEAALRAQARKGNEAAVEGLIRLYSEGRRFGDKRDELEGLLASGAGRKNGDTAFRLAVMLLSERDRTPEQTQAATRLLSIAQEKGSIGMKAAANTLLAQMSTPLTETTAEAKQ